MIIWKVSPKFKKSLIERNYWVKDDNTIVHETGWRGGEFYVYTEDDAPPVLEEGVDIYNCEYESELIEAWDGCWEETNTDNCSEEVKVWLEEFLEENSIFDLDAHGWVCDETEMIIDSEVDIERVHDE